LGRLFWKFFFSILLAQILATIAIGGTFWLKDHARNREQTTIEMGPPATFMVGAASSILKYGGTSALLDFIKNMHERQEIYVVNEQGHDLLGRQVDQKMLSDAKQLLAFSKQRPVVKQVQSIDGNRYLLFLSSCEASPRPGLMPHPEARGFLPGGYRPPPMRGNPLMQLIPELAAILASLIFAALLAWYFAKPIRGLRSAFKTAASGNLNARVGTLMGRRRDELADLGKDFDGMASQLNALMDGQRRLLHDVSHELRSPLARMQLAIGLAKQQPDKTDASLERIERESIRMDRLIDELLTLSRLEAGVMNANVEHIPMGELLSEIANDARFEAATKDCHVELVGNSQISVYGNHEMLHRAIDNVVRNAVKHTAAGSTVTIVSNIDKQRGMLHLSIQDQGPGVPEASLQAIFEPFFRADVPDNGAKGHGLGLAIAQRVVKAHGGSISALNRQQGGLSVEIAIPMSSV
jgi:two-component system OmpR family sensor kinase